MTLHSVPCQRFPAALAVFAVVAIANALLPSLVAADDDTDFRGDLELPDIVRFTELPRRMYLEPEISIPANRRYVADDFLGLAERMLVSGPDNEIRIEAITTLEQIHVKRLVDISHLARPLRKLLGESDHVHVRQACASALAAIGHAESAIEVAQMCHPEFESLCVKIEPEFVSWGNDALKSAWVQRIKTPDTYSTVLVRLASEGLTQLRDTEANAAFELMLGNVLAGYVNRHSAARALGALDHKTATITAERYAKGNIADRLLACALLRQCVSEPGIASLGKLCDDNSDTVASRAWKTMLERDPEQLVEKLDVGVRHRDSNVRFAAIQVIDLFPTEDSCRKLHVLMGDVHIGVRNSARRSLAVFAGTRPDLSELISRNAGMTLSDPDADWQQLEQSLVLLGQLRERQWQNKCLPLLEHDRPEVLVTAAWLLHLMPQRDIAEQVGQTTLRRHKLYQETPSSGPQGVARALQLTFLFQHAGFTELTSLQNLCAKQFSKGEGDPEKRAAGLWALGKINKGDADPTIAGKLTERIFDDALLSPEFPVVRRMSVAALVWMNARSAVKDMLKIRQKYGVRGMLGETARWALPQLGAKQPPALKALNIPIGNFSISPL
ncbi:MAG: HEAT repeat domain-containing protein [Fuerstiella sp.]|nr:HEAT repeat domain-containing protein [Fuerstiella sp.]